MINIHLYPSPFLNESRILREATSLAELRLFDQIDLIGVGDPALPVIEEVARGVRILRIGRRNDVYGTAGKVIAALRWCLAIFLRYRRKPLACINCHSVSTLPLGVLLKRVTGAKLVYDAHELETEANGLHGFRKAMTKRVERAFIQQADFGIFVGKAIENWYVSEYGLQKTAVLYNCPRTKQIATSNYFRDCFGISADKPIFLYQGVIAKGRGMRILIDAFSDLADCAALVIMGYGPLAVWCAEQAGLRNNIHYHPAVPPDSLLDYTSAADYGLSVIEPTSMSYEYCMPNKLFEYVMAGKPVLVSPTLEQMRIVQSYAIGDVAESTTAIGVRNAALRLLARPAGSFDAALRVARKEFNWEQQELKLENIYKNGLGFERRHSAS